jgi:hypothetical protein
MASVIDLLFNGIILGVARKIKCKWNYTSKQSTMGNFFSDWSWGVQHTSHTP